MAILRCIGEMKLKQPTTRIQYNLVKMAWTYFTNNPPLNWKISAVKSCVVVSNDQLVIHHSVSRIGQLDIHRKLGFLWNLFFRDCFVTFQIFLEIDIDTDSACNSELEWTLFHPNFVKRFGTFSLFTGLLVFMCEKIHVERFVFSFPLVSSIGFWIVYLGSCSNWVHDNHFEKDSTCDI